MLRVIELKFRDVHPLRVGDGFRIIDVRGIIAVVEEVHALRVGAAVVAQVVEHAVTAGHGYGFEFHRFCPVGDYRGDSDFFV